MAYNENLVNRIREALSHVQQVEEKHMFGGVCFMVNEKMCVGVVKEDMMCRIDPLEESSALEKHGCRPMDFTGRPMKGYVYIDESGMRSKKDLEFWISLCLDYNKIAKSSKKKK